MSSDNDKFFGQMVGDGGSLLITGTNAVTGKFWAFVTNEDTVFTHVYETPEGGNPSNHVVKADLESATIYANLAYSAGYNSKGEKMYFDSIQLTSGSIIAYKLR